MEVLITVVLMGTAMVAFCSGMFMMVKASDMTQRQALAETELRRLAESVRAASYKDCALANEYPGSLFTLGSSFQSKSVAVQYWVGGEAVPSTFDGDCTDGDKGVQKLKVTVVDKSGLQVWTDIYKRES
jgi:Tfp pilus assembly protein PilV